MRICVFGLGEAGARFAADLASAGASVAAYDPAAVPTPDGVERHLHPSLAVAKAEVVLSLTAEEDAELSLLQSVDALHGEALYADLSTSAPSTKHALAEVALGEGIDFADVALMAMVPGNGLATPTLACGTGAERYVEVVSEYGGKAEVVDGGPGTAARRKLLRSIMMKGTAAVLLEAVQAGAEADDLSWLWANLSEEIVGADEAWLHRMASGSKTHAVRRAQEMEAAKRLLEDLGVAPLMTDATISSLRALPLTELPSIPVPD